MPDLRCGRGHAGALKLALAIMARIPSSEHLLALLQQFGYKGLWRLVGGPSVSELSGWPGPSM